MSETLEHTGSEQPTPEEALGELRQRLGTAEAQRRAAEERASQAETRANQTGAAVQGAHEAALDARISAEQTKLAAAKASYRAARESGDLDAETEAQAALASATQMVNAFNIEKARIAAQRAAPQPQQSQPQPQGRVPGPAARQWMADHPKIDTDETYAYAVEQAHQHAVNQRLIPESPGYFAAVNAELERSFGPDHGRDTPMPAPQRTTTSKPPAASYATPPSRGSSSGARSSEQQDVQKVCDAITALGGEQITPQILQEHADACKMSLKDYVASQMNILSDRRSSRQSGMGADIVYR